MTAAQQDGPDGAAAPRRSALREPDFVRLMLSQGATEVADAALLVALTWTLVTRASGSALGLVLAAWAIPRGTLLLLGGVLADRVDRRTASALSGAGLAVAAGALALGANQRGLALWLVAAVALGVLDAVRIPVLASMTPFVVSREQLVDANRWSQLREWLTLTLGPAIGGVATAAIGARSTIAATAAGYAVSAALFAGLRPMSRAERPAGGTLDQLRDGLRFVIADRRLRLILPVLAMDNLFVVGGITVAVPIFVRQNLHAGAAGLGAMSTAFGIGMAVGTLLTNRVPARWQESLLALFALFAVSNGLLATVGAFRSLWLAAVAFGLCGLVLGPAATLYRTMLQTVPPEQYLGRVAGIARATTFGLEPASTLLVGQLSRLWSGATLLVVAGVASGGAEVAGALRALTTGRASRAGTAAAAPAGGPGGAVRPPAELALPGEGAGGG